MPAKSTYDGLPRPATQSKGGLSWNLSRGLKASNIRTFVGVTACLRHGNRRTLAAVADCDRGAAYAVQKLLDRHHLLAVACPFELRKTQLHLIGQGLQLGSSEVRMDFFCGQGQQRRQTDDISTHE